MKRRRRWKAESSVGIRLVVRITICAPAAVSVRWPRRSARGGGGGGGQRYPGEAFEVVEEQADVQVGVAVGRRLLLVRSGAEQRLGFVEDLRTRWVRYDACRRV